MSKLTIALMALFLFNLSAQAYSVVKVFDGGSAVCDSASVGNLAYVMTTTDKFRTASGTQVSLRVEFLQCNSNGEFMPVDPYSPRTTPFAEMKVQSMKAQVYAENMEWMTELMFQPSDATTYELKFEVPCYLVSVDVRMLVVDGTSDGAEDTTMNRIGGSYRVQF